MVVVISSFNFLQLSAMEITDDIVNDTGLTDRIDSDDKGEKSNQNAPVGKTADANGFTRTRTYTPIQRISDPQNLNVELAIAEDDLELDLLRHDNVILRIRDARDLILGASKTGSIGVNIFELSSGKRELVASQRVAVKKSKRAKTMYISQDLGDFDNTDPQRFLEVELEATDRSIAGIYRVLIVAKNPEGQIDRSSLANNDFTCDESMSKEECIRAFILNKVDVLPNPSINRSAILSLNKYTGNIEIKVPLTGSFKRNDDETSSVAVSGVGTGAGVANFGEVEDTTIIRFGDSIADYANWRYDPTGGVDNGHFILGHGQNGSVFDNFYFSDKGKLGIGVVPQAFLDITAGTATMPQVRLATSTLTTLPIDGALEFDGTDLYLTKGGVRSPIVGAGGSYDLSNGGTVGGALVFDNPNGTFLYAQGAQTGYVWTSNASGVASWQPLSIVNAGNATTANFADEAASVLGFDVNGATVTNVSVLSGSADNTNITNSDINSSNFNNNTINDNVVNGKISFGGQGSIFGDLEINGMLTATKFMGDGSMITNILGSNITNGSGITVNGVEHAINTQGLNPNSEMRNVLITNSLFNGGLINGSTLYNMSVPSNSFDAARVVTNLGDPGVFINVNGDIFAHSPNTSSQFKFTGQTIEATGFIGDGSDIDDIPGSAVNGFVANANHASTTDFALEMLDNFGQQNVTGTVNGTVFTNFDFRGGGTIKNVTISNSTFGNELSAEALKLTTPGPNGNPLWITNNAGDVEMLNGNNLFISTNGITATKFMGDGSMLTNINPANVVNLNTTNVTNAQNAQNATAMDNGAITASELDNNVYSNVIIEDSTIVNSNFAGMVADAAHSLVSPNGLIDPAVSVANSGFIDITNGNLFVNGNVTAHNFDGDASMLTNLQGPNFVGAVPNATTADTAQNVISVTTADNAINVPSTANGYVNNALIENSQLNNVIINGSTLKDALITADDIAASQLVTIGGATAANTDVNGHISILNGDLTLVSGIVTALKFTGNGSMLTNLQGSEVTGSVEDAVNAQFTNFAPTAVNANFVEAISGGEVRGSILNSNNFVGGVVNGTVFKNIMLTSLTADAAAELITVNGETALTVDVNGNALMPGSNLILGAGTDVIANKFVGDGSMIINLPGDEIDVVAEALNVTNSQFTIFTQNADMAFNMFNGNIAESLLQDVIINGTPFINVNISGNFSAQSLVSPDGDPAPALAVDNGGNLFITNGDLTVNGDITALKFSGDGSMLTNIEGANVNGVVANSQNAINAQTAQAALNTQNADLATLAASAANVVNGTITNTVFNGVDIATTPINDSTITNAFVNGTTLINTNIVNSNVPAIKMVAPDASPDPAVSVDNDGNVVVEAGNLTVNGELTAAKFMGDGSMITNISAAGITGSVPNVQNAITAQNALSADSAITATNLANGLIADADFTGSSFNNSSFNTPDVLGALINGSNLINTNLSNASLETSKLQSPDGAINPAFVVANGGSATIPVGDLTVNGMVTADKFIGDGSMLTNITAANINGAVAQALNAQSAQTAVNVDFATTVTNVANGGTISNSNFTNSNFDNVEINNSSINGIVVNGANLINTNISSSDIAASSLKAPDGDPDPAVSVDNNGNVFVEAGDLTVNGTVTADKFIGDASMITNISGSSVTGPVPLATNATTAQNALNADLTSVVDGGAVSGTDITNSTITNSGISDSSFTGGLINGAAMIDPIIAQDAVEVSKLVSANGSINPAVSVDNGGNVAVEVGDLTVNGMVTATKFIGDGSMLTNISAANINGAVAEAINAQNAQNAFSADFATTVNNIINGTISNANFTNSNFDNIEINDSTISGIVVNGANLVNVNISNSSIVPTKLVSPDGSPDPAVSVDNNGNVLVEAGDLTVNGMLTADKFMGDGSMLTNIQGSSVVGPVDFAINVDNADSVTSADFANRVNILTNGTISGSGIADSSIDNGSFIDSSFLNGIINGTVLVNAVFADGISSATKLIAPDGDPDPAVSVDNNGHVFVENGDLTVNGMLTAIKFMGDGSMIANIQGSEVNGAVATALNSQTTQSALSANHATTVTNLLNGEITNATIIDSDFANTVINESEISGTIVINGANLVNTNISSSSLSTSSLRAPDGDPDPALSVDNNGNVFVENGDLNVSGMLTADKFMGDGSMITNISGSAVNGVVAEAINAQNAQNADNATLADLATNATNAVNAQNVINGTIINTNIVNSVFNGVELINVAVAQADVSELVAPDGDPDPAVQAEDDGELGVGRDADVKVDVDGAIRPGHHEVCDETVEGAIRYNFNIKYLEYCDGNEWLKWGTVASTDPVNLCDGKNQGHVVIGPGGSLTEESYYAHATPPVFFTNNPSGIGGDFDPNDNYPTPVWEDQPNGGRFKHRSNASPRWQTADAFCRGVTGTDNVYAAITSTRRFSSPYNNYIWLYNEANNNFDRVPANNCVNRWINGLECRCGTRPANTENWYKSPGINCRYLCSQRGMNNTPDPNGYTCASGEAKSATAIAAANAGIFDFKYGCWPDGNCQSPSGSSSSYSRGSYCYRPGQKRDYDRTDKTVACHCE